MKAKQVIPIVFGIGLLSFTPILKPKTVTLEQALADGTVSLVAVESLGGHSGKCVKLTLQNNQKKPINIQVDGGSLYEPEDEGDQTLYMPETRVLAMEDGKRTFKMNGFCTELHDRSPSEGSGFAVNRTQNVKLDSLSNFLASHPKLLKDPYLIQDAVWCITDNRSPSYLHSEEFEEEGAALRAFVCKLTGKPNFWYNTHGRSSIGPDRRIVNTPVEVAGQLEVRLEQPVELKGTVYNSDGEVVWARDDKMKLPRGEVKFWFRLTVKGWPEGDYYVEYKDGQQSMLKQEFTI